MHTTDNYLIYSALHTRCEYFRTHSIKSGQVLHCVIADDGVEVVVEGDFQTFPVVGWVGVEKEIFAVSAFN